MITHRMTEQQERQYYCKNGVAFAVGHEKHKVYRLEIMPGFDTGLKHVGISEICHIDISHLPNIYLEITSEPSISRELAIELAKKYTNT